MGLVKKQQQKNHLKKITFDKVESINKSLWFSKSDIIISPCGVKHTPLGVVKPFNDLLWLTPSKLNLEMKCPSGLNN